MIKSLLREFYYIIYDILTFIRNLNKDKNFIIIFPRLITKFFGKILIYDKINKNYFIQNTRNKFDVLTVFEIFAQESYNLNKLKQWEIIYKKYSQLIAEEKKPLYIDLGSNIGSSCEYFSRVFKNIYSILIEPNILSAEFSRQNITNKNYDIINKAISSEIKLVNFDDTLEDNRSSKVNELSEKQIQTTTVNEILNKYIDFDPFIIKIDIEGFEEDLFIKNYDWINKFQVIIIELHDWMMPYKSNSFNFFNALNENMKKYCKRDIIISDENLILIKINEK